MTKIFAWSSGSNSIMILAKIKIKILVILVNNNLTSITLEGTYTPLINYSILKLIDKILRAIAYMYFCCEPSERYCTRLVDFSRIWHSNLKHHDCTISRTMSFVIHTNHLTSIKQIPILMTSLSMHYSFPVSCRSLSQYLLG
jgi:hypothetical protein